jgi:radical SAM superfamily enzyme YgiQ (UPF0313 family)
MKILKNKKIVFLAVNASYSHFMLSYAYLRAYTEDKQPKWSWNLIEQTINDDLELSVYRIAKEKPDIIISTLYLFNHEQCIKILQTVAKILPNTFIFLGGPEFLGNNNQFLKRNLFVDAVFRGDESSFFNILNLINDKSAWENIPGICYISKNKYFDFGNAQISEEFNAIPSPYKKDLIPNNKAFVQLETSRGCHGNCAFCTSSISNTYNIYSLNRVKADLQYLREKGIKEIRILDRTFNENTQRTLDLLEIFNSNFPEMHFHLEFNPALLNDSVLTMLQKSPHGKFHIEVGIQTLQSDISKNLNRYGSTKKALLGLINLCNLTNIEIHADLLAGLPEQNYQNIINDIKILIKIAPTEIQLEILKMLPGTKLHAANLKEIIYNSNPPYQVIQTNNLTFENIQYIRCMSKVIDSYYNSHYLQSLFKYLTMKYENFLEDFTISDFIMIKDFRKKHLKERFLKIKEFIQDFSDYKDLELLKFSWLTAGLPISEYDIKSSSKPIIAEKTKLIWQSSSNTKSKRHYTVTFEYPISELYLHNTNTILDSLKNNILQNFENNHNIEFQCKLKKRTTTYLFKLAYGNNPSQILEIL